VGGPSGIRRIPQREPGTRRIAPARRPPACPAPAFIGYRRPPKVVRGSVRGQGAGGATGVRTPDLLNAIQTLFQLSYSPQFLRRRSIAGEPRPAGAREGTPRPYRARGPSAQWAWIDQSARRPWIRSLDWRRPGSDTPALLLLRRLQLTAGVGPTNYACGLVAGPRGRIRGLIGPICCVTGSKRARELDRIVTRGVRARPTPDLLPPVASLHNERRLAPRPAPSARDTRRATRPCPRLWHDPRMPTRSTGGRAAATEIPARVRLPGGELAYTLRRSTRARHVRVTVDPGRGVVATVPGVRTSEARARALVEPFLAEREAWLRGHLARHAAAAAELAAAGPVRDGSTIRYRGELHLVRVVTRSTRAGRRSRVERVGGDEEDQLVVTLAPAERRALAAVLEAWLRVRAREALDAAIARHATALGVRPTRVTVRDTRSRWGSASRAGRLSFSWRLVLAPPGVLETVAVHELAHLRVFGHGNAFWVLVAARVPDHAARRRWLRTHAAELHAALAAN
jgi:predicted metal-dependent hydrolase